MAAEGNEGVDADDVYWQKEEDPQSAAAGFNAHEGEADFIG